MRHARVSAMALMLAAVPATSVGQQGAASVSVRDLTVRVEIGNGPSRVYGVWDRDGSRVRDRYDDRYDRRDRYERSRGRGPAFCRSGAGHPVHGRRWCVEKGFGLGGPAGHRVRWRRMDWHDVVFGRVWYRTRSDHVDGRVLVDVIGRGAYGRLDRIRGHLGGRHALTGRWLRPRGGALILEVRSGPLVIAELSDLDGDGRVEMVMVADF